MLRLLQEAEAHLNLDLVLHKLLGEGELLVPEPNPHKPK